MRKLVQAPLERSEIAGYRALQEQGTSFLLMNLLRNGEYLSRNIHLCVVLSAMLDRAKLKLGISYATTVIMQITYGQHVLSTSDELFVMAEQFVKYLVECDVLSLLDISPYCEVLSILH